MLQYIFPLCTSRKGRELILQGYFIWGSGNSPCALGSKFSLSDFSQNNSFVARTAGAVTVTVTEWMRLVRLETGGDCTAWSNWLGRRVQSVRGQPLENELLGVGKGQVSVSCGVTPQGSNTTGSSKYLGLDNYPHLLQGIFCMSGDFWVAILASSPYKLLFKHCWLDHRVAQACFCQSSCDNWNRILIKIFWLLARI